MFECIYKTKLLHVLVFNIYCFREYENKNFSRLFCTSTKIIALNACFRRNNASLPLALYGKYIQIFAGQAVTEILKTVNTNFRSLHKQLFRPLCLYQGNIMLMYLSKICI